MSEPRPEYALRGMSVEIPVRALIGAQPAHTEDGDPDRSGMILDLIEERMRSAQVSVNAQLSRALWPRAPWYRRLWQRLHDTALVLAGRRIAVTERVAFHRCPTDDDEE